MRILILGAGGFIGSNLVEHLVERAEHEVVGVDVTDEKLEGIGGANFRFIRADVTEAGGLIDDEIAAADVVVDLIAYANPSIYVVSPLQVVDLNFTQNVRVVEACVRHGRRLIQYSTSEVYGKPTSGTYVEDETDLLLGPIQKNRWIYASSKQLLERVIHAHGLQGDLDYTIVRPFNFIGPRLDYLVPAGTMGGPRVFAHFLSALLTGGPIYLVNGGEQRRSFTHIADANACFQTFLDSPGAHNQVFNVGNPANDTSIRELADLMTETYAGLTGEEPANEVLVTTGAEFYGPGYEDSSRVLPDISKARSLGWEPTRDLRVTIADAMRHARDSPEARRLVGS